MRTAGQRLRRRRRAVGSVLRMVDRDLVAAEVSGARHRCRQSRGIYRGGFWRTFEDQGLCRRRVGTGIRGIRCRESRCRRDGPRRFLLSQGQSGCRPVFHVDSVRHELPRNERLALLWRRSRTMARALRANDFLGDRLQVLQHVGWKPADFDVRIFLQLLE